MNDQHFEEKDYWIGEPMDLRLKGNSVLATGAVINNATINYEFWTHLPVGKPGVLISVIPPGTVAFVAGSQGDYFCTIPAIETTLQHDSLYFLRLYGGPSTSAKNNRFIKIKARYRSLD